MPVPHRHVFTRARAPQEFEVYANKLKEVPAAIGELKQLKLLNLFNNQLRKLPVEVGSLPALTEVNVSANKLMMLTDAHFSSWARVTTLNLNDNNLSSMGSFAPMVALKEVRIYGNQLGALPTLAASQFAQYSQMC